MHLAFVQPVAVFVHQEMSFVARTEAAVPAFGIIGQDLAGGADAAVPDGTFQTWPLEW